MHHALGVVGTGLSAETVEQVAQWEHVTFSTAGVARNDDRPFDQDGERRDPWWGDPGFRAIPLGTTEKDVRLYHLHIDLGQAMEDGARSIGKLAKWFQDQGGSVMLAAGDTFRAAAREQLAAWGERNNVPVIGQQGGDPGAVVFDAIGAAKARGVDVEVIPLKSEELATQAVINGQVDMGQGTPYAAIQKVNVPVLGIIENMSGFECPKCGTEWTKEFNATAQSFFSPSATSKR